MTMHLDHPDTSMTDLHQHLKTNESPASVTKILKQDGLDKTHEQIGQIVKLLSGPANEGRPEADEERREAGELQRISSILPAGVVGAFGKRASEPNKKHETITKGEKKKQYPSSEEDNNAGEISSHDLGSTSRQSNSSRRHGGERRRKASSRSPKRLLDGEDCSNQQDDSSGRRSPHTKDRKKKSPLRKIKTDGSKDETKPRKAPPLRKHTESNDQTRPKRGMSRALSAPRLDVGHTKDRKKKSPIRKIKTDGSKDETKPRKAPPLRTHTESNDKTRPQRGMSRALSVPRLGVGPRRSGPRCAGSSSPKVEMEKMKHADLELDGSDSRRVDESDGSRRGHNERRSKDDASASESCDGGRPRRRMDKSRGGGRGGDVCKTRSGGRRGARNAGNVGQNQLQQALINHDMECEQEEMKQQYEEDLARAEAQEAEEEAPEDETHSEVSVKAALFAPAKLAAGFASKAGSKALNVAGKAGSLATAAASTSLNIASKTATTAGSTALNVASAAGNTALNVASTAGNTALNVASGAGPAGSMLVQTESTDFMEEMI